MLRSIIAWCVTAIVSSAALSGLAMADTANISFAPSLTITTNAKWRVIQRQVNDDAVRLSQCRIETESCTLAERQLLTIVEAATAQNGLARIGEINRAVNLAIRSVSDERRFNLRDQWSPPLETMAERAGDCEDYAILKYLMLREAGFASADLQLVILRDARTRTDHAVLAVRFDERWLMLDNRTLALAEFSSAIGGKRYQVLAQLLPDADIADIADVATAEALVGDVM